MQRERVVPIGSGLLREVVDLDGDAGREIVDRVGRCVCARELQCRSHLRVVERDRAGAGRTGGGEIERSGCESDTAAEAVGGAENERAGAVFGQAPAVAANASGALVGDGVVERLGLPGLRVEREGRAAALQENSVAEMRGRAAIARAAGGGVAVQRQRALERNAASRLDEYGSAQSGAAAAAFVAAEAAGLAAESGYAAAVIARAAAATEAAGAAEVLAAAAAAAEAAGAADRVMARARAIPHRPAAAPAEASVPSVVRRCAAAPAADPATTARIAGTATAAVRTAGGAVF